MKLAVIGTGIGGLLGGILAFSVGASAEGIFIFITLGWVIGEILAIASR